MLLVGSSAFQSLEPWPRTVAAEVGEPQVVSGVRAAGVAGDDVVDRWSVWHVAGQWLVDRLAAIQQSVSLRLHDERPPSAVGGPANIAVEGARKDELCVPGRDVDDVEAAGLNLHCELTAVGRLRLRGYHRAAS
jgi:hypothetical protein